MKNKNRTHKGEFLELVSGNFKYLNLLKRYNTLPQRYDLYIINNIIFNNNTRIVSHFKDFLIYDEPNDFIQRFYSMKEGGLQLKFFISFYEENNKIFPNYFCLPESKYLYRNIQQKQNILNNIENINNKYKSKGHSYSTIFSSSIKFSIYNESVYPSNSMNSNGDEDLKKLIKVINDNYSTISHICKKDKSLNTVLSNSLEKENHINKEMGKFTIINNNLLSKLLFSKKKEKGKMNDIKKEIKNDENNSNCLSEREKYMNLNSKDNKDVKHKRISTYYNKELMNICGKIKNTMENGKNSNEAKEKLKSLIKTIKYIIKKNNNNAHKNKNINHYNNTITEIDNINININTNNKISITSPNLDKNMNINNNKIINSVLNSVIQTKRNNYKNINKKTFVNQTENLKIRLRNKIKAKQGNNSYKVVRNRVCSLRNEHKANKNLLNHIKTNSILNSHLLTESISKINKYKRVLSNNNSISFNIPFYRKKRVNKSTSIESFPKLRISSTKKKYRKKILIKNNTKKKRNALTDVCCIKENHNKNKTSFDNNNKKYNKYLDFEYKNEFSDFPTQINFRAHQQFINKYKNTPKNLFPNTIQKVKSYKKEKNRSTFLTKSNINKNLNSTNSTVIKNLNCSKLLNLGTRSRNNTTLNSLNINLTGINNLKMINNLYTTVNIYGSSRNKNNVISGKKTERTNNKLSNGTYYFDNKKLFKKLNASKVINYLNEKKQPNNNLSNNIIKKVHNKTNSSSINNTESTFSINKTSNNFNHILKANILHNNTYTNYFDKIKKIRFKNVRPMLIKKYDKEIIYPQKSNRIQFRNKNESLKIKTEEHGVNLYKDIYLNTMESKNKENSTIRKLSNDEKKANKISNYSGSENNKKSQKKIKIKKFKQLIAHNIKSDRKEIDRTILHDIFKEKKSHQKIFSSGNK